MCAPAMLGSSSEASRLRVQLTGPEHSGHDNVIMRGALTEPADGGGRRRGPKPASRSQLAAAS
jgi:hypothetical protein